MKRSNKFYASLVSALVLTSGLLVPSVNAETTVQPLPSASTTQSIANAATFKNEINTNDAHEYIFKTNGGNFTITDNQPENVEIGFFIYNLESEDYVDISSAGTYQLSSGTYVFSVSGYSEEAASIPYEYGLTGPFSQQPDTTLPNLNVTSPANQEIQLAKGSSTELSFMGTTDAQTLTFSTVYEEQELNSPGAFQKNVTLGKGDNLYMLTATEESGNSIVSYYSVSLPGVTRLQGKDRYEVSSNISKELTFWNGESSGTVVIAKGDVFSDALSGGPLATSEFAPILLTTTNSLPISVKDQIKKLAPEKAIILGGTGSVSTNVEAQLKELGVTTIDRIGGKDRYAVSASVGERISESMESDTAIIASGEVFPDALSASTIAGPMGMPVLLVQSGNVPESIQTYIKNHPEIQHFIIVGGPATVKQSVEDQLRKLRVTANIERIGGKDRYEVSINVAKYGIHNYGMDLSTVAFARGDLFPDALSGAPLANIYFAPILLTSTNSLEPKVDAFLKTFSNGETKHIYIFGGLGSVSQNTENQLYNHIR
ncbi:cell wall-binding repeat-containing protein [Bacillus sp. EB106-08-02-XG196]|jgi:putative cell wall-binding protein|uniref:cell wall-binding repeat-containing protein n=1 Tax=Bacillus sp. EB106-08-02-XG196 TaxID=2737049 RepID=UPI0015C4170A|nr:cell wall-binding repeat-containing protein [Bacillus sp. EB106-08-02-XG196]NWQ39509.1 cell wall-binding repeat-containing protein [Bacillus sp. EB106-08-02-XG196]